MCGKEREEGAALLYTAYADTRGCDRDRTERGSITSMPGRDGLRMTEQRVLEAQHQLTVVIESMNDDLDCFGEIGASDKET